jgi:hypothetical protein
MTGYDIFNFLLIRTAIVSIFTRFSLIIRKRDESSREKRKRQYIANGREKDENKLGRYAP